jgi:TRAP-type C4-dicarboxylate transport system permease small subunit
VDFFYKFMPQKMARLMATLVDVMRVVFLASFAVLTLMLMLKLSHARMTMVNLPMNLIYGVCLAGFVAMTWRAIQVARFHWKHGYSVLERPETTMAET